MKQNGYIVLLTAAVILCMLEVRRQNELVKQLFGQGSVTAERAVPLEEHTAVPEEQTAPQPQGETADHISLDVPIILQNPELPTGCEAVALTMALAYAGIEIDKTVIARDFLVYNYEDDNMALGYVGDPFSDSGAGCFAPAICKTAENFFEARGVSGRVYDITGTKMDDLLQYVSSGTPVIVWTTMHMAQPDFTEESGRYGGREYRWYRQEHCVVLSGCDRSARTVQVNDPLDGIVQRDLDAFRRIYEQTGSNAVILYLDKSA